MERKWVGRGWAGRSFSKCVWEWGWEWGRARLGSYPGGAPTPLGMGRWGPNGWVGAEGGCGQARPSSAAEHRNFCPLPPTPTPNPPGRARGLQASATGRRRSGCWPLSSGTRWRSRAARTRCSPRGPSRRRSWGPASRRPSWAHQALPQVRPARACCVGVGVWGRGSGSQTPWLCIVPGRMGKHGAHMHSMWHDRHAAPSARIGPVPHIRPCARQPTHMLLVAPDRSLLSLLLRCTWRRVWWLQGPPRCRPLRRALCHHLPRLRMGCRRRLSSSSSRSRGLTGCRPRRSSTSSRRQGRTACRRRRSGVSVRYKPCPRLALAPSAAPLALLWGGVKLPPTACLNTVSATTVLHYCVCLVRLVWSGRGRRRAPQAAQGRVLPP